MSKQDRQGARTVAQLEQKYSWGKRFLEILGIAEEAQDAANKAAEAVKALEDGLTPEAVFNLLTNNGEVQGIFRGDDGQIYINASYIVTGLLLADYIKADTLDSDNYWESWEELNAALATAADAMPINTVKFISGTITESDIHGFAEIQMTSGLDSDLMRRVNVTMVCSNEIYTRYGYSEDTYLEDDPGELFWDKWVKITGSGADSGVTQFTTDETLNYNSTTGVLSVNTADAVEEDNTLPITSAAVHTTVGNIEILLGLI